MAERKSTTGDRAEKTVARPAGMARQRPWLRRVCVVVGCVSLVAIPVAQAGTTTGDRQALQIRDIEYSTNMYFTDFGAYPTTDISATWFEKLVAQRYAPLENYSVNAGEPLDEYDQPLVFEVLSPNTPNSAVVRSIGANGIDDHGALDDWDSRFGANFGYWNKSHWPELYWSFAIGLLVFAGWLAGIVVFCRRTKRFWVAGLLITAAWSGIFAIGVPAVFGAGMFRTSVSRNPGWVESLSTISLWAIPFCFFFLCGVIGVWLKKRNRLMKGCCPGCGYDLRGADHGKCPECGEAVKS